MNRSKILISLIILMSGAAIATGILWFNLAYSTLGTSQPQPYVSCSASSNPVNEGNPVTFNATIKDYDTSDCTLSYSWTGSRAGDRDLGCSSVTIERCTTPSLYSSVIIHSNYSASNSNTYDLGITAHCGHQTAFSPCTVAVNHPFRSRLDVSVSGQGVTHLACVNNFCASVSGSGDNSCSPEGAPCHFECTGVNVCASVSGSGPNRCSNGGDCFLNSISVSLNPSTILVSGSSQGTSQANAVAHYDNNSTSSVTSQAIWRSGNTSVATISSSGLITGHNSGTTIITAIYSGKDHSVTLTVSCPSGQTRPHNECSLESCVSITNTCDISQCSTNEQCLLY